MLFSALLVVVRRTPASNSPGVGRLSPLKTNSDVHGQERAVPTTMLTDQRQFHQRPHRPIGAQHRVGQLDWLRTALTPAGTPRDPRTRRPNADRAQALMISRVTLKKPTC
jgi:hypothetical protein